jgi:hypothetical protein
MQPPKMSIAQAMKSIDNLISSIVASRVKIGSHRIFSKFSSQKLDISPTYQAISLLKAGLDTFSSNFGDFFDAADLENSLKYLLANEYDFINTGAEATTASITNLKSGLEKMSSIKTIVTTLLTQITTATNKVTSLYQNWKDSPPPTPTQPEIYLSGLKTLDTTLLDCKIFWDQTLASILERNFELEFAEPG